MGLDSVEILMEVEESFGITIPEDCVSEMRTVGDLFRFLVERTRSEPRESDLCLTAATFYSLRRQLAVYCPTAKRLRPKTRIPSCFPLRSRRRMWSDLGRDMDLRLPALHRPSWLTLLLIIISFIAASWAFSYFQFSFGAPLGVLAALFSLMLSAVVLFWGTRAFAVCPNPDCRTLGELATQVLAMNYGKLSDRHNAWNAADVWAILSAIIVEQLGVPEEQVTPEAQFVRDLGCD